MMLTPKTSTFFPFAFIKPFTWKGHGGPVHGIGLFNERDGSPRLAMFIPGDKIDQFISELSVGVDAYIAEEAARKTRTFVPRQHSNK